MNEEIMKQIAWCRLHPTGYLGKDQFGQWYRQCWTGKKRNETCVIVIEKKEVNKL